MQMPDDDRRKYVLSLSAWPHFAAPSAGALNDGRIAKLSVHRRADERVGVQKPEDCESPVHGPSGLLSHVTKSRSSGPHSAGCLAVEVRKVGPPAETPPASPLPCIAGLAPVP
jgi:hypothetical protein